MISLVMTSLCLVVVKLLALRPPCARKPPLPDSHTRLYTIGAESPALPGQPCRSSSILTTLSTSIQDAGAVEARLARMASKWLLSGIAKCPAAENTSGATVGGMVHSKIVQSFVIFTAATYRCAQA